jgi:hypothetical protein
MKAFLRRWAIAAVAVAACLQLVPSNIATASTSSSTYQDLQGQWANWVLSVPNKVNPLLDKTGKYCAQGQQGDTWFLVGTTGGEVSRQSCRIPAGKSLFFPLLSYGCVPGILPQNGGPLTPEASDVLTCGTDPGDGHLYHSAKEAVLGYGGIGDTFVTVDGVAQPYSCVQTQPFTMVYPYADSPFGPVVPGSYSGSYYGCWALVAPLSVGKHNVTFGGSYPGLGFTTRTSYRYLTVE